MAFENLTWLTGKPVVSRPVEALSWVDPDVAQVPFTKAPPAVDCDDYFRHTGDIRVTVDPALLNDRVRYEKARQTAEEQVAIDLTALVCEPAANEEADLAGLYLHLSQVASATPSTV